MKDCMDCTKTEVDTECVECHINRLAERDERWLQVEEEGQEDD